MFSLHSISRHSVHVYYNEEMHRRDASGFSHENSWLHFPFWKRNSNALRVRRLSNLLVLSKFGHFGRIFLFGLITRFDFPF